MRSIHQNRISTYEIQKSKFITYLFPIQSMEEVTNYLKQVREEHPNATHHCYAYLLENYKKCSDDGEPSGTAGIPILNVLEKQHLNYILCIVVRYFGGILLGAGGLIRAYTTSVVQALKQATYVTLVPGKEVFLTFSYENKQTIDRILNSSDIIEANYYDYVQYRILLRKDMYDKILNQIQSYIKECHILKDCYYQIEESKL